MLSLSLLLNLAMSPQAPAPFEEKIPGTVVSFKMIPVPPGSITIRGQKVEVKGIAVSETEVTWDAYDIYAFLLDVPAADRPKAFDAEARPSKPYGAPDRGFGHAGFPALGINSRGAIKFCEWLSQKTGKTYRLPTEAEWEYTARAGQDKLSEKLDDVAWHWDNSEQPSAVKKKKPNPWGLYDVLGNVMEWTIGLDGTPVCAGGSYYDKPAKIGFDFRKPLDPEWQADDAHTPKSRWWLSNGAQVGFRIVCELK